ncbi:hypothetical protein MZTS_05555 [Methylorubrum zatmanii]|nr:thioesterase domain-containing protein [Methylorubrum zatmanii]MBD8906194.1 hypothetical protein [Methylorubrum zatmanii]
MRLPVPEPDPTSGNRDVYTRLDRALATAGLGEDAHFLNWGYRPVSGEPDAAVLPVGAGSNADGERLVAELLGPTPLDRRRVLDVGCGRGGALAFLAARARPLTMVGIDLSPDNVARARRALAPFGARLQVADACALPQADASQDVVLNLESSGAYADLPAFLRHVARVLRSGGTFVYGDLWPAEDEAPLRRTLDALGFEEIAVRDVTRQVLAARAAAPTGVLERLSRADPELVEAIGGYFALPGSPLWEQMASGHIRYGLLRLRRREGPIGCPDAGDADHLRDRPRRMSGLLAGAGAAGHASRTWFPFGAPSVDAAINVLAFPFAAAGASVFRGWEAHLPAGFRFCPVQLPGREHRVGEPAFRSVEAAVEALLPLLEPVRHRPLALLGWSLGCKLAFALARRLEETGTVPRLLMLGACPSPDRPISGASLPRPGESWAEPLRRLGGTDEVILGHDGMLGTLRDCLEGDFAMATDYRSEAVIAAPILAVAAEADSLVRVEAVAAWKARTGAGFTLHTLPGGHFALRDSGPALARLLADRLAAPTGEPEMPAEDPRPWLPFTPAPPRGRPQIVCFHHAGGSAGFFRPWLDLPELTEIAICPIELPGRGSRFGEAPRADLADLARSLSAILAGHLDWSRPVLLFGHSLGALIAYETALRLEGRGLIPRQFVASARRAPDVPTPQPWRHDREDGALLAELSRIGGTDAAILQHRELMALMLPAIRADFALTDPYHRPRPARLECPILTIRGRADAEIGEADMSGWAAATRSGCTRWEPEGDHFYLADPATRNALAERLAHLVRAAP